MFCVYLDIKYEIYEFNPLKANKKRKRKEKKNQKERKKNYNGTIVKSNVFIKFFTASFNNSVSLLVISWSFRR